jgi:type IV pilus biogenesis/stability protein PilW
MAEKFSKITLRTYTLCSVRFMAGFFGIFFILSLYACATTPSSENLKKADVHYKLGVAYLNKNQLKDAHIKFQEALRFNPKDKHSLNALGLISTVFKEYDKAVTYYKRAIAIDPDFSDAMNNLGVTYMKTENLNEAMKYFQKALKNPLYSTPDKAYANLGYALYKSGNYHDAQKTLQEALTKYPKSHYSAYWLGHVYTRLGKIEAAIEVLKKAVDLAPYFIDARWELANAYLRVGDNEKALEQFELIAETGGNDERGKQALKYIELLK